MDDFMINRVDRNGRSIYLNDRPATTPAVIYSGPPGMGKSYLLRQAATQAKAEGQLVISIDASSRESIQSRMTRAIGDQLDQLGEQTPFGARGLLRKLRKTLDTMLSNRFGIQDAISGSLSWWAPLRLAFSHGRDQQFERPTSSVNDLADRLADLADSRDQRVMFLIDNLDRAQESDLATINELAAHLRQHDGRTQLVMGASQPALDNLLAAASPDGITTDTARCYDVRICEPISDSELRPALTSRVARAGSAISSDAVDKLVEEAAGDPGRLQRLADRALDLAEVSTGISADIAAATIDRLRAGDSWLHHASWANLSARGKAILAEVAATPAATTFADLNRDLDPDEWAERDAARTELVGAGLIKDSAGELTVADPGLRQWVVDHSGSRPLLHADSAPAHTATQAKAATRAKDATQAKKSTRKTSAKRSTSTKSATRTTARKLGPPDLQNEQSPLMRTALMRTELMRTGASRRSARESSKINGRTS